MKSLAQKYPIVTFLLITFTWTWIFWFGAIPFQDHTLLVTAMVLIGGSGPAIGGILTLSLRNGPSPDLFPKRIITLILVAIAILTLMALRYASGNVTLSVLIVLTAIAASLVGGWVISSAFSSNSEVRARMASILPWRLPLRWTMLGFFFFPALILLAWEIASIVGAEVEYPELWGRPVLEFLPPYALAFGLTFLIQGGNEEPGWRGFMQPELQKRFSPLTAALTVSVTWSLWHLPLWLNGFYGGDLVGGMILGGIYRILLAIFLAWFYNCSGRNVFLMMFLHASFNLMPTFLPTSILGQAALWLIVVAAVTIKDKMWRKLPEPQRS